jgi:hypothetical protein
MSNNTLKLFFSGNKNTRESQNQQFLSQFIDLTLFLSAQPLDWLLLAFLLPPNKIFPIRKNRILKQQIK